MKTLVNIFDAQEPLAAYLFLKQYYQEGDRLLFIATRENRQLLARYAALFHLPEDTINFVAFKRDEDSYIYERISRRLQSRLSPETEYWVNLAGGTVTINSSDDAINAANSDALYADTLTYAINVTGAKVTINSRGDGLDSNGDINLIAGSAVINSAANGGEAGLDFVGSYYLSDDFDLTNNGGVAFDAGMGGRGGQMGGRGQMGQNSDLGQSAPMDTQPQTEAQPNFFQRIANWFSNLFSKK